MAKNDAWNISGLFQKPILLSLYYCIVYVWGSIQQQHRKSYENLYFAKKVQHIGHRVFYKGLQKHSLASDRKHPGMTLDILHTALLKSTTAKESPRSARATVAKPGKIVEWNTGHFMMQLEENRWFCTKTRWYKTKGLFGVQTGDSSLRQFTFNNGWVKLLIYSPLLLFFPSFCLRALLSLRWWKAANQRGHIIFLFSHMWCHRQ